MRKLSFVIPCYNSEKTIRNVVSEVIDTVSKRQNFDYEIILVNDYSPDNVWHEIIKIQNEDPKIIGINFAKNFGQHAALMAGYHKCTGEIIISLDDDGQSPADELFLLVDEIDKGYDVVYGCYKHIKQNAFRKFGSHVNKIMTEKIIGKPKGIEATSYYAAKLFIIKEMIRYDNAFPYVAGLVFRSTKNIGNVIVDHRSREVGHSGYTIKKLFSLWINGFTAFSVKPLRIATVLGFICALSGFLFGIYTIVNKLINPEILLGYSSMMAALMFIGGIIMLMLGLIGEYIGRIYISANNAPQYVLKEIIDHADQNPSKE